MIKEICSQNKCTGCSCCYNICPKNAIEMKYNENGELIPHVNKEKCINCNKCIKACPANTPLKANYPQKAFAAWSLVENERKTSSSGGIAITFYKYILNNNGDVYGTSFDKQLNLEHSKVNNINDVEKFKGSKYVQSNIGTIYKEVKSSLDNNIQTLFIGTPCQVDGLNSYLNKEYENLITVDLICHGVPSQKLFREHTEAIEKNVKQKADNITFRGNNDFYFTMYKNNNIIYKRPSREDKFFLGFLKGMFNRESCYNCKYAIPERTSDITIGDFWGLGSSKEFKHSTKNGVSLILTNTQKGNIFLDKCKDNLFIEERELKEAIEGNAQLKKPSVKNKNYDKFKKLYIKHGFEKAASMCLRKELNAIKKEKIEDFIKLKIKTILGK